MIKRPDWDHHSSSTEPIKERTFGGRPVIGQTKSYDSGSNAHGVHQKPRGKVAGAGEVPMGGPYRKE